MCVCVCVCVCVGVGVCGCGGVCVCVCVCRCGCVGQNIEKSKRSAERTKKNGKTRQFYNCSYLGIYGIPFHTYWSKQSLECSLQPSLH